MLDTRLAIRPAIPTDAPACAFVHRTSWIETYSDLLPASHWESDTLERRTGMWQRWLDAGREVSVAADGERVIGFAIAGTARAQGDHPPARDRELSALYVLASHHGTGAGQALLDAALPAGGSAQLWVAEENPRARRFYGRNGFTADGARFVDPSLDLAEIRLVR